MPKDAYYIKLDTNAPEDTKIKLLRKYHGNMKGFGQYIYLILRMRMEDNYKLPYEEFTFEALAVDMDITTDEAQRFIDDCIERYRLFTKANGCFYSERLLRDMARLDARREQASYAGKASAKKRYQSGAETANSIFRPYKEFLNVEREGEAREMWERVKLELSHQVNKSNFQAFLAKTTGYGFQDNMFYVITPNQFIAEHITNNLYSLVEKTAFELFEAKNTKIKFIVGAQNG